MTAGLNDADLDRLIAAAPLLGLDIPPERLGVARAPRPTMED